MNKMSNQKSKLCLKNNLLQFMKKMHKFYNFRFHIRRDHSSLERGGRYSPTGRRDYASCNCRAQTSFFFFVSTSFAEGFATRSTRWSGFLETGWWSCFGLESIIGMRSVKTRISIDGAHAKWYWAFDRQINVSARKHGSNKCPTIFPRVTILILIIRTGRVSG